MRTVLTFMVGTVFLNVKIVVDIIGICYTTSNNNN